MTTRATVRKMQSMKQKSLLVLVLIPVFATVAVAQRSRGSGRSTPTKTTGAQTTPAKPAAPAPSPAPVVPVSATPPLALVNDVSITAADIETTVSTAIFNDPDVYLHAFYQDREKAIREARQRAVDARVSSMLIAAEAKKRGLTAAEWLDREINSRIPAPTDSEIRAIYDANRTQLGNADLEAVRPNIISYIRAQRSEQARAEMVNRLKMTNTVQKNADVNAPNLAPGIVLASVNGNPLRIEVINERMKSYIYRMESRIHAAQRQVLDRRINDTLIIVEANKRKVGSEEIVRTEVTDKLKAPTEAEITKFFEENKARLNADLASLRDQIARYLQDQQQERLETELAARLRAGAKVQVLLKEPSPPALNIATGRGVSRGDLNAAVKIVEFTDFQCSACGAMYPVLEEVLKSYGNRVYFEVRNFPLTAMHPHAFRAAQAAAAANAQGQFWPYIDLLYKNQTSLDDESLKKYATQAGLDRKRFDADLDSGKFDENIRRDLEEGDMYGIESTPTIYINGVMLTTLSPDGLREVIDKALARAGKSE